MSVTAMLVSSQRVDLGIALVQVELFCGHSPDQPLWATATIVADNRVALGPKLELVQPQLSSVVLEQAAGPSGTNSFSSSVKKGPGRPKKGAPFNQQCPHCPRICSTPGAMKRHIQIHAGEFACPHEFCYATYKNQTSLTKHLRERHDAQLGRPQDKESLARRKFLHEQKKEAKRLGQGKKVTAKNPAPVPSVSTTTSSTSASFSMDSFSPPPDPVFAAAPSYSGFFDSSSSLEVDPVLQPLDASFSSSEVFLFLPEEGQDLGGDAQIPGSDLFPPGGEEVGVEEDAFFAQMLGWFPENENQGEEVQNVLEAEVVDIDWGAPDPEDSDKTYFNL